MKHNNKKMETIHFTLRQYRLKHTQGEPFANGKVHGTKTQVRKTQLKALTRSRPI